MQAAFGVYAVYAGDAEYELVTKEQVQGYYDAFRAELSRKGFVSWQPSFDCNHFSGYMAEMAKTSFALENWGKSTRTAAIGQYWYRPASGKGGHAVVCALTPEGPVFFEPQNGRFVAISPAEQGTKYLVLF